MIDARQVSIVLRKAGFTRSTSSGSRIRGAPFVSRGYKVTSEREPTYFSNGRMRPPSYDAYTGRVFVTWEAEWRTRDRLGDEGIERETERWAEALRAAGYAVERVLYDKLAVSEREASSEHREDR